MDADDKKTMIFGFLYRRLSALITAQYFLKVLSKAGFKS